MNTCSLQLTSTVVKCFISSITVLPQSDVQLDQTGIDNGWWIKVEESQYEDGSAAPSSSPTMYCVISKITDPEPQLWLQLWVSIMYIEWEESGSLSPIFCGSVIHYHYVQTKGALYSPHFGKKKWQFFFSLFHNCDHVTKNADFLFLGKIVTHTMFS